jgi:hypothetical protein
MNYHTTFHSDSAVWDEGLHDLKPHCIPVTAQSSLFRRRPARPRVLRKEAAATYCLAGHAALSGEIDPQ